MSLATVTARVDARRPYSERDEHDWYVEPPEAVEALLQVEPFSGSIWDPACGQGTIPRMLLARGDSSAGITASDLVNRGLSWGLVIDFLAVDPAGIRTVDNIITNPPFKLLEPFIERAMEIVRNKAAFLVRLSALEGMKRHERIFSRYPLARIHVFSNRISMPPGGRGIEAKGGAVAFCWWVFDKLHQGPPSVHWIQARKNTDTGGHL